MKVSAKEENSTREKQRSKQFWKGEEFCELDCQGKKRKRKKGVSILVEKM